MTEHDFLYLVRGCFTPYRGLNVILSRVMDHLVIYGFFRFGMFFTIFIVEYIITVMAKGFEVSFLLGLFEL